MNMKKGLTLGLSIVMAATLLVGCGGGKTEEKKPAAAGKKLAGSVKIDGSSTVFPISEAMAEEFRKINPDVKVRYAYYASDNPLETGSTLASGGLGTTGVKPTYLITIKILEQIFNVK